MGTATRPSRVWARSRHITEETRQKQAQVLRLRKNGLTFEEAAHQMGVSKSYARHLYMRALTDIISEDVKEVRALENMRLDQLQVKVQGIVDSFHPYINSGAVVRDTIEDSQGHILQDSDGNPMLVKVHDASVTLAAVRTLLQIIDMRAKINGLYAPTKLAQTDPSGEKEVNQSVIGGGVMFYLPENGRDVIIDDSVVSEQ